MQDTVEMTIKYTKLQNVAMMMFAPNAKYFN